MKLFIMILCWAVAGVGVLFIPVNLIIGLGIWIAIASLLTIPLFLVFVPEVTGLVVLNYFSGQMRVYGPGMNLKLPWEAVRKSNFYSLEIVTVEDKETYAAEDGPMMLVGYSYQYHPRLDLLINHIQVDESTIKHGLSDVVSGLLSAAISQREAEDARKEIKEIQQEVMAEFDKKTLKNGTESLKDKLECHYGINFKLFTIADMDFGEGYQEMRSAAARMRQFGEAIKNTKKHLPTIKDKDAANIVLVEQKKAQKTIYEVEGLESFGGAGGAILKLIENFSGTAGGKKKSGKKERKKGGGK